MILQEPEVLGVHIVAAIANVVEMDDYGCPSQESVEAVCRSFSLESSFVEEVYWTLLSRKRSQMLSPLANDLIFDSYLGNNLTDQPVEPIDSGLAEKEDEIPEELQSCTVIMANGNSDGLSPSNIDTVKQDLRQEKVDEVVGASNPVDDNESESEVPSTLSFPHLAQSLLLRIAFVIYAVVLLGIPGCISASLSGFWYLLARAITMRPPTTSPNIIMPPTTSPTMIPQTISHLGADRLDETCAVADYKRVNDSTRHSMMSADYKRVNDSSTSARPGMMSLQHLM